MLPEPRISQRSSRFHIDDAEFVDAAEGSTCPTSRRRRDPERMVRMNPAGSFLPGVMNFAITPAVEVDTMSNGLQSGQPCKQFFA